MSMARDRFVIHLYPCSHSVKVNAVEFAYANILSLGVGKLSQRSSENPHQAAGSNVVKS